LTWFADLVTYCKRENVPYQEFESFSDILATMKDVVAGKVTIEKLQHAH
jgi:2-hydroxy-3-keto-5-methylthiopentenyl-1-phosphate phosphatase